MGLTLTQLQGVFKNTVNDSIQKPTIWVDPNTGEEQLDCKYVEISYMDPTKGIQSNDHNATSYVDYDDETGVDLLFVNGPIKQVGSHVKYCGPIGKGPLVYEFPIEDTFKYAKNLEEVSSLFYCNDSFDDFIIPEKLLWNCPKLRAISNLFMCLNVYEIPSKLLAKCPELKSIYGIFQNTKVHDIPEDLFNNNPKITDFADTFNKTKVTKIPDKLFDQFKNGIISHTIDVSGFVANTPLANSILYNRDNTRTTFNQERQKRDEYFPSYFSPTIQNIMMAI